MLMSVRRSMFSPAPIRRVVGDNLHSDIWAMSRTTARRQRYAMNSSGTPVCGLIRPQPDIGVFNGLHVAPDCHQLAGGIGVIIGVTYSCSAGRVMNHHWQ